MPDCFDEAVGLLPRRRTQEERMAYLAGFEAGVQAMVDECRRLNFPDVGKRAEQGVGPLLRNVIRAEGEFHA